MLLQELKDLKEGDQVVLNKTWSGIDKGTILTRKKCWMDDDLCVKFTYGDGLKDFHYFSHSSVDFIKDTKE